jgi:phosphohistidine phosphatase
MRLYLVQHGQALTDKADPFRPLSETGESDVRAMAAFLAEAQIAVARIVHSGKLRARQTAELLARAFAGPPPVSERSGLNPNDPPEALASELTEWQDDAMIVGHLPFLGRLVALLVSERARGVVVAFRPGSVVCLEPADAGGWLVAWVIRPELLSRKD